MSARRLLRHTLFCGAGSGWKINQGRRFRRWRKHLKTFLRAMRRVGTVRLPKLGPRSFLARNSEDLSELSKQSCQ